MKNIWSSIKEIGKIRTFSELDFTQKCSVQMKSFPTYDFYDQIQQSFRSIRPTMKNHGMFTIYN